MAHGENKVSLVNTEMRVLESKVLRLQAGLKKIMEEDFGRKLWDVSRQDALRLLTLEVWQERYKVPVRYMLKTILPFWHSVISKRSRRRAKNNGLGCKIVQLVSRRSEDVLVEQILKDYPSGENVLDWRMRQRAEQVLPKREGRPGTLLKAPEVEQFAANYAKTIGRRQRKMTKAQANSARKRRRYRDNPWL